MRTPPQQLFSSKAATFSHCASSNRKHHENVKMISITLLLIIVMKISLITLIVKLIGALRLLQRDA